MIKHKIKIILSVLLLFHFLTHLLWIHNNHLLSYDEDREHIQKFLSIFKNLNNSWNGFFEFFKEIRSKDSYWPVVRSPFLYIFTGLLCSLIGFSYFRLMTIFFIFFAVIVLSTYCIGKKIADEKTGLCSAFFISFFPVVFHYTHIYNVDLLVAAMVSLALYFFIDYCDNRSNANMLKLGVICGLGMLTKPSFILFTIFPCIGYWIFNFFKNKRWQLRYAMDIRRSSALSVIKKLLIFLIPFLILSGLWYEQKIKWVLASFIRESFSKDYPAAFSSAGVWFYPAFFYNHNGAVISLALVLAAIKVSKIEFKNKNLLFLWLIFSYLALNFLNNKQLRFCLPLMPVVAIIFAIGTQDVWRKWAGKHLLFCFAVFLILQFFYLSFFHEIRYLDVAKKSGMLFSRWHRPPQRFWNTERGKKYLLFFNKVIFISHDQKEICDRILAYYNYSAFLKRDENDKDSLPLEDVFIQYLITRNPELLLKSMSDMELFHLFIHNKFYFITDKNEKNCWPDKDYITKKLSLDRFYEFNIKNKLLFRSPNEVVFTQKEFLPPNMYRYWYKK